VKNTHSPAEANGDVGAPKEWYSRGYLPHCDAKQLLQAVTFRLADSLPQEKLKLLEEELSNLPENQRSTHRRAKIEQWLDAGMGCCALRHPKLAEQIRDALLHFEGQRYQLLAWCIMPNHVHVLMETLTPIARIIQGWKSVTARWALAHNEELKLCQRAEDWPWSSAGTRMSSSASTPHSANEEDGAPIAAPKF